MYTLHVRHGGVGVAAAPHSLCTLFKWSYLLSLPSFFPRLVLLHKYICTSLRELLSLSHLNRSTWHRLRLHSVAFKASGAPDSVSFFFVFEFLLFFSFFACRVEVARKKRVSSAWESTRVVLRRFSQSNSRCSARSFASVQRVERCVCVCARVSVCV